MSVHVYTSDRYPDGVELHVEFDDDSIEPGAVLAVRSWPSGDVVTCTVVELAEWADLDDVRDSIRESVERLRVEHMEEFERAVHEGRI